MSKSLFFYDLETSGLNPRFQRIMQFAGQRTDMNLQPIGEPTNVLVKLSEDILPEPQAILITGTTPQKTLQEGIGEPEFARLFSEKIATPDTIMVGFNSVRFDDEFMRHTLWRNFYDPYEWSWSSGRSRWDILDVVRMTRALRPNGIEWPTNENGEPVNKLELLSKKNNLEHSHAHDALSDVEATIGIARLIKEKQPKLFDWLLTLRHKREVAKLINLETPQPFVYSSGRYGKKNNFTTIALPIAPGSRQDSIVVYDLRYDPLTLEKASQKNIADRIFAKFATRQKEDYEPVPVKELLLNKCPAVAPINVMDESSWQRLSLDQQLVMKHLSSLTQNIKDKIAAAYANSPAYTSVDDVEGQLYDGFINDKDKGRMSVVRASDENELSDFHPDFADERLSELLLRYKARWFSKSMSHDEHETWQLYRQKKWNNEAPRFISELERLSIITQDEHQKFLLQEMKLWLETTSPIDM
jgi:exodeoxyribonuclease-1